MRVRRVMARESIRSLRLRVRRLAGGTALVLILMLAGVAPAQTLESRVAAALRVEWERVTDSPRIEGSVHNDSQYRIGLVRLRVTTRDDASQTPGEMLAWVFGNVPARGHWTFSVRVPQGREVVGVTIESFKLIALEKPAESP